MILFPKFDALNHKAPTRTVAGLCLLLLTFLIFAFPMVNDPDFGWHLKAGQTYVTAYSIPSHDIFSFTMSQYPWVNHEYAIDAFSYLLFQAGANTTLFLSLFYLFVAVFMFLVVFPRTFNSFLAVDEKCFVGLIALLTTRPFFGVRPQIFDWLGFLLIILIWKYYERGEQKNILWWCAPIFFVWANIHGGFLIGFFLLGLFMLFSLGNNLDFRHLNQWISKQKKKILYFTAILGLSGVVTLFNPYGWQLHLDIMRTIGNEAMRDMITEWGPSVVSSPLILPFTIYIFFIILLLMTEKREYEFSLRDTFCLLLFLLLALASLRFIPFFILLSLPIIHRIYGKNQLILPVLTLIAFASFFISIYSSKNSMITNEIQKNAVALPLSVSLSSHTTNRHFYAHAPQGAFEYIRLNPLKGNLFNDYDWGGSLIWSLPDHPVFIDGRMPYWEYEGRDILQDYLTIMNVWAGWDIKIERYDIEWFLIKKTSSLAGVLETLPQQWEKTYEDNKAIIFERKK
ncbi:MAG: hypothetical protein Q8R40_02415 [bacterium]|nr:hypothetical protein [bacterium]